MTSKHNKNDGSRSLQGEPNPEDVQRLQELLSRLVDSELKSNQQDELGEILKHSENARSEYIQFVNLHAGLGYASQSPSSSVSDVLCAGDGLEDTGRIAAFPTVRMGPSSQTDGGTLASRAIHWMSSHHRIAASVAIALSASCLFLFTQHYWARGEFDRERVQYAARVVDGAGCVWESPVTAVAFDGLLRSSDTLRLEEGLAKLRFGSGAEVLIKGPANLFIESGMNCRLDEGELTANVPRIARGFTVNTPLGRVVDLGTAFGVKVGEEVEMKVFEGEIEVYPGKLREPTWRGGAESSPVAPVALTSGASRQLRLSDDSSTVNLISPASPGYVFTRHLPEEIDPTGKKPTVLAVDSFGQGLFGARLLGCDGGFGWSSAWSDEGVDSNSVSFAVRSAGVISRGSGDGALQRRLAEEFAAHRTLFFSAEFQIDGPDQICSAWLEVFKHDADRWSNGELDLVTIGITDGQFSGRMAPWGTKAEEKVIGDCGSYEVGTRHLIVGKLEFNAVGSQERLSVWVNPALADEPYPDRVILKNTGWEFADAVAIRCWEMDDATSATVDEVRVGLNWAAVVQ